MIGAGAIGCLVAGYLKLKGEEVMLVGHAESVQAIKRGGLHISGVRGVSTVALDIAEKLGQKPDLAILATKTQDLPLALKANAAFIQECPVVTAQNGVRAEALAAEVIPQERIISSIVMFGATYLEAGQVVHNFEGSWIIGRAYDSVPDDVVIETSKILDEVFPAVYSEDIRGMKYLKVFINANNCIPAILGVSMQEAFADNEMSRISIAIWREGLAVVGKAGVRLESLPGFPVENIMKLTVLPAVEGARIFSGMMTSLSKEPLYGSILQSLKRGRASEIDFINGEFIALAGRSNDSAPLNAKLVEMVHAVEKNKKFFSKEELLRETRALCQN